MQSEENVRSWKSMAQEAINVQDACNLSGVVHSFSRIIKDVRERLRLEGKESTENVNTHPVCILYADKINSLSIGAKSGANPFGGAYGECKDLAK